MEQKPRFFVLVVLATWYTGKTAQPCTALDVTCLTHPWLGVPGQERDLPPRELGTSEGHQTRAACDGGGVDCLADWSIDMKGVCEGRDQTLLTV